MLFDDGDDATKASVECLSNAVIGRLEGIKRVLHANLSQYEVYPCSEGDVIIFEDNGIIYSHRLFELEEALSFYYCFNNSNQEIVLGLDGKLKIPPISDLETFFESIEFEHEEINIRLEEIQASILDSLANSRVASVNKDSDSPELEIAINRGILRLEEELKVNIIRKVRSLANRLNSRDADSTPTNSILFVYDFKMTQDEARAMTLTITGFNNWEFTYIQQHKDISIWDIEGVTRLRYERRKD